MSEPAAAELVTVHLLQFPVPVAAKAREHFEGLIREFALIKVASHEHERPEVPQRLMSMVDALTSQFAGVADGPRERVEDAIDRGDTVIDDHVMHMPREAGPASAALATMLDEADEFCQQGQHLLSLATPPELVRYRHWYLGQIAEQLNGAKPTPWPHYRDEQ